MCDERSVRLEKRTVELLEVYERADRAEQAEAELAALRAGVERLADECARFEQHLTAPEGVSTDERYAAMAGVYAGVAAELRELLRSSAE